MPALCRSLFAGLLVIAIGCQPGPGEPTELITPPAPVIATSEPPTDTETVAAADPAPSDEKPAADKPKLKNLKLEIRPEGRRVLIEGKICIRKMAIEVTEDNPKPQWPIELFLCKEHTKEHEAIVSADIEPRQLHALLIAAGGEPGGPVRYQPRFWPAYGSKIKVTVRYTKDGKTIEVPAQEWVKNASTGKPIVGDWVFAGSKLYPHPEGPDHPALYGADSGDVICVSNFETALLDVPFASSKENDARLFDADLSKIPTEGTPVTVILEPLPTKK